MEASEGMNSGVVFIGANDQSGFHVVPRTENTAQLTVPPPMAAPPATAGLAGTSEKKKRGRPRKYGPDGAIAKTLSPMPISISAPPPESTLSPTPTSASAPNPAGELPAKKTGRGRPIGSKNKQRKRKDEPQNLGELSAPPAGARFVPHVIFADAGEDITMKIISFSQQGPRAVCVFSATGAISNVTIRQRDSSGSSLTYEGCFDILSLSGSFVPAEIEGSSTSRSGGISIALAGAGGHVLGGLLSGLLIAAGPVQLVVGSFLPSTPNEWKPKKQKTHAESSDIPPGFAPSDVAKDGFSDPEQPNSAVPNPNFASTSTYGTEENWDNNMQQQHVQDSSKGTADINLSLHGE